MSDSRTILLVKTSSLGDVVHNFPALTDLAQHLPGARVDWAVEEAYAPLVRLHPAVRAVVPVAIRRWRHSPLKAATWREFAELRARLRAGGYDTVIDTQGLLKSALVARFAPGVRCGFARASVREPLATSFYTRSFAVARDLHAIERCRALVAAVLGYRYDGAPRYGLAVTPAAAAPRAAILLHGTARVEKQWPESDWIELARRLAERGITPVLPWGDAAERVRSERIAARVEGAIVAARRPLDEVAALLAGARVVIGVDTGLLHVAAALGVPTVGIFGASDPALTGPVGAGPITVIGRHGAPPAWPEVLRAIEVLI